MNRTSLELPVEPTVKQAREHYRSVLAHWGLESFTDQQLSHAVAQLRAEDRHAAVTKMEIRFRAAMMRLRARKDLVAADVDSAFKQLLAAEQAIDQALWERHCDHAAQLEHAHQERFRSPAPRTGGSGTQH